MDVSALSRVDTAPASAPVQAPADQPLDRREIVHAVQAANRAELLGEGRELAFRMDRETQRPVIEIVDRKTREVIQQVPPEYVLRATEGLQPGRENNVE